MQGNEVRAMGQNGIEYFRTGIEGFDYMAGKGIPRGSQILISGGPGTLKTTFCMQVLVNAAKKGKVCLYLSFEESAEGLLSNMAEYGWAIPELMSTGRLLIKNEDPFRMSRSVETLLAKARGELLIDIDEARNLIPQGMVPDIIVVDSLSAISAGFFGKDEGYRAYISQLFTTFKKMGLTTLLVSEIEHSTTKYSRSGVEEFLADAVFAFYNLKQGSQRVNATEIIKLRGSEHKKKIVPFKAISGQGIQVYPSEEIFVEPQ